MKTLRDCACGSGKKGRMIGSDVADFGGLLHLRATFPTWHGPNFFLTISRWRSSVPSLSRASCRAAARSRSRSTGSPTSPSGCCSFCTAPSARAKQWSRHLVVLLSTFALFPLLGIGLKPLLLPLVTPALYTGILFLCTLPSTVQSSIAFTSMAEGNVPAAVCSASASSLLGIFITPALVGLVVTSNGANSAKRHKPKRRFRGCCRSRAGQLGVEGAVWPMFFG